MSGPGPLPGLPAETGNFLSYLSENDGKPLRELIQPYLDYESKLRGIFAQDPSNEAVTDNLVGLVPVYNGQEGTIKIRARDQESESKEDKAKYIMELDEKTRKKEGDRAIVDFDEFKKNFALFSEGALHNLDWTNIVAAGSSVLTPILPVPEQYNQTKRALRDYYHETLAPTSDVDLFIYGTKDEEVAIKRMEAVEATIRDNLLWETTTIRTKNTVTIVSQYPNRHVQIVLRLYSSISEILTGFDVNCACVAYDGQQVYANPRAITSWMLQCNDIDLTRRSPSYEFRLSKYRGRGFEVYYPGLTRDKIDPTIYERNINRLKGLAKLLVLEKLPDAQEREAYLDDRRNERGRPARTNRRVRKTLRGDLKAQGAEVPEWDITEEEQSNYHTVSIPYGKPHNAKRSEKLLFQKDMLLNAEWNKRAQKDRAGYLHRHPAFIGSVKDVITDCCSYCPEAKSDEEKEMQEKDDKTYVRGNITFLKDDPGRQEIGSFNPITEEDWTELAYINDDETLCRAIVSKDAETVKKWLAEEGHDVNRRDHTGRTALHLAALASTPEIVKLLLDAGAKMVWRIVDGRTALHFAASRGDVEIVKLLLLKSQENEEIRDEREDKERAAKGLPSKAEEEAAAAEAEEEKMDEDEDEDKDEEMDEDDDEDEDIDMISDEDGSVTARTAKSGASSFVEVKKNQEPESGGLGEDDTEDDDVLDINLADWDYQMAPLHYAIINGHKEVVELLVGEFGADVLQAIKVAYDWQGIPRSALLSITLIVNLPKKEEREIMLKTLLELGASSAQADMSGFSAFIRIVQMGDLDCLKILFEEDAVSAMAAAKHVVGGSGWRASANNSLLVAIRQGDADKAMLLLEKGVNPIITFDAYMKALKQDKYSNQTSQYQNYQDSLQQAPELALEAEIPEVFAKCIELGADPSMYTAGSHPPDDLNGGESRYRYHNRYLTLLDYVKQKAKQFSVALENMRDEEKKSVKKNEKKDMVPEPEFEKGTYEYWMASQMIKSENESRKNHNKLLEKSGGRTDNKDPTLVAEKHEKLKALESRYKELAELLISKGGKTFKELQPEIWKKANQKDDDEDDDDMDEDEDEKEEDKKAPVDEFKVKFNFSEANKDEKVNDAYQELYKAAWNGDEEALKKYSTTAWEEEKSPLLIATKNQLGYTLFSVAVYRKQPKEFLDLILSIAAAQYAPVEEKDTRYDAYGEYSEDYSDYSDEDDEAELRVEQVDLTEGKLTIDNVAELGKEVKSKTKAADIILESVPIVLTDNDKFDAKRGELVFDSSFSLSLASVLLQAISVGDVELATYLTTTIEKLNGPLTKPTQELNEPSVDNSTIVSIRLENISALEDLMKKDGVGPLFREAKKKGDKDKKDDDDEEEPVEKPKQYLGLSIHGKRRKDWAKAANPNADSTDSGSAQHPMALHAAFYGSHKVYEWLKTEAPEKAIREWQSRLESSKDAQDNYYLKTLRKADSATIKRWMGIDHPLLLHAIALNAGYVTGKHKDDETKEEKEKIDAEAVQWYENNMKFFLKSNPGLLESKENGYGLTPLLLAGARMNKHALKALINLGADLYAKTPDRGLNIAHVIINGARAYNDRDGFRSWDNINDCLSLLPEDVKQWAFTQRAWGDEVSYTPLAYYLSRAQNYYGEGNDSGIVKLVLKHSKGVELGVRTTLGDLPIHSQAKAKNTSIMQQILDACTPEIIVTENANGMTALELADAKRYQHIVGHIPTPEYTSWGLWTYDKTVRVMNVNKNEKDYSHETEDERKKREERDTEVRYEEWGIDKEECAEVSGWKMLNTAVKKALDTGVDSRVLVSLREANETAERLAKRQAKDKSQRRRRYYYYNQREEDGEDIVIKWLP